MHRLIGHAIVSADDRIADAAGRMPPALHNDADWALFQAALDRSALILLGRLSHQAAPNPKRRRRLVVSGAAQGLERRDDAVWFDPASVPVAEALRRVLPDGGDVAVVGGQGVFELAASCGFAAFHLARVRGLRLPGGRGLFRACESGAPAAAVLAGQGLRQDAETVIDRAADVTLAVWRRPA